MATIATDTAAGLGRPASGLGAVLKALREAPLLAVVILGGLTSSRSSPTSSRRTTRRCP